TAITGLKQWLTYSSGAPFQPAVAAGLGMPPSAFEELAADLRERRDLLTDGLREIAFRVSVPAAGYFTVADAGGLGEPDAEALAQRLPTEAGVVAIPLSAFYRDGEAGEATSWLRMAVCKSRSTIEQALEQLDAWAAPRRGAGPSPTLTRDPPRDPRVQGSRGGPCAGSAAAGDLLPAEGAAGGALRGAGGVEVRSDAAAVAGEAGAQDQGEVHLLRALDHARLEHQRDLLRERVLHLLQQGVPGRGRSGTGGAGAEHLGDRGRDRRMHGGPAALGEAGLLLRHRAQARRGVEAVAELAREHRTHMVRDREPHEVQQGEGA